MKKKWKNELVLGNRPRILMIMEGGFLAMRVQAGKKTTLGPEMHLPSKRTKILFQLLKSKTSK